MRFLDFRKYIFANLASLFVYIVMYLTCMTHFIDFPDPVLDYSWGEPNYVYSDEEQALKIDTFICMFMVLVFLFLSVIEFIIRFLLEKFVFKEKIKFGIKLPKWIIIPYSILFYLGFVIVAYHFCSLLFFYYTVFDF